MHNLCTHMLFVLVANRTHWKKRHLGSSFNLANKVPCIEPRYLRMLSTNEYKQFSLARSYMSTFKVNYSTLKTELDYSLGVAFRNMAELNRKPPVTEIYFEIDNRLQRSGYLLDGLLLFA